MVLGNPSVNTNSKPIPKDETTINIKETNDNYNHHPYHIDSASPPPPGWSPRRAASLITAKQITRVWTFASDSNPNVEYETLQYTDGSTSCNCKGWTRRVAPDGSRSCKHTRSVDMGTADDHCKAFVEALYVAFDQGKEPTDLDIAGVLTEFVPLSKLMAEHGSTPRAGSQPLRLKPRAHARSGFFRPPHACRSNTKFVQQCRFAPAG